MALAVDSDGWVVSAFQYFVPDVGLDVRNPSTHHQPQREEAFSSGCEPAKLGSREAVMTDGRIAPRSISSSGGAIIVLVGQRLSAPRSFSGSWTRPLQLHSGLGGNPHRTHRADRPQTLDAIKREVVRTELTVAISSALSHAAAQLPINTIISGVRLRGGSGAACAAQARHKIGSIAD